VPGRGALCLGLPGNVQAAGMLGQAAQGFVNASQHLRSAARGSGVCGNALYIVLLDANLLV